MTDASEADLGPLVHRAVLPVSGSNPSAVFTTVRAVLGRWLGSKGLPIDLASGVTRISDDTTLNVAATYRADGTQQAIRAQLSEAKSSILWRTTVTATRPPEENPQERRAWVSVELEVIPKPGVVPPPPAPPRLIGELLDDLVVMDGPAQVLRSPQQVGPRQVAELIDILCDPARRLPALVATQPTDQALAPWVAQVSRLTARTAGVASVYVLGDEATVAFNEAILYNHRVGPGSVRSFLSAVDPASPSDANRHRVMSHRRIVEEPGLAKKILSRYSHGLALSTPLPPPLRAAAFPDIDPSAWRELRGAEEAARRAVEAERAEQTSAQLDDAATRLKETSHAFSEALHELERLETELQRERARSTLLADQRQQAQLEAEDEIVDHDDTRRQLSLAQQTVRELQLRLRAVQAPCEPWRDALPEDDPTSFELLLEQFGMLPKLGYTGDHKAALELDDNLKGGTWASKAWNALRALNDYALARDEGFTGTFRDFCQDPPAGVFSLSLHQVAMDESDTVRQNKKMHGERVFKVPSSVASEGKLFMGAHLKLDRKGQISPRIHFYDDTAGRTGKVWIGYVGRHLTNTMTS